MRKKLSLPKLKDKAWAVYSRHIRLINANQDGFVDCVTCDKTFHWKKIQAGHFVSGRSGRILFADKNVHPQCYACNVILSSNWDSYFKFMEKTYGMKTIRALMALKNKDKSSPLSSTEVWNKCEEIIQLYSVTKEI